MVYVNTGVFKCDRCGKTVERPPHSGWDQDYSDLVRTRLDERSWDTLFHHYLLCDKCRHEYLDFQEREGLGFTWWMGIPAEKAKAEAEAAKRKRQEEIDDAFARGDQYRAHSDQKIFDDYQRQIDKAAYYADRQEKKYEETDAARQTAENNLKQANEQLEKLKQQVADLSKCGGSTRGDTGAWNLVYSKPVKGKTMADLCLPNGAAPAYGSQMPTVQPALVFDSPLHVDRGTQMRISMRFSFADESARSNFIALMFTFKDPATASFSQGGFYHYVAGLQSDNTVDFIYTPAIALSFSSAQESNISFQNVMPMFDALPKMTFASNINVYIRKHDSSSSK